MDMVKMFDLPVDLCAIDFATQLYSPELLALNPIHSLPFLVNYAPDGKATCINGSEAITLYLVNKFRSQVPDAFLPSDPLANADILSKAAFIMNVAYRATMYQYVYPLMGLMSECQYDLCKRDFALDTIEAWGAASEGNFLTGSEATLADLYWYNLWLGNNWVANDEPFASLPWRHKDVIDKYPASKLAIESTAALEGVQAVDAWTLADPDRGNPEQGGLQVPSIQVVNATGMFGMLKPPIPVGRNFKQDGDMMHPNFVGYSEQKAEFDKPIMP